MKTMIRIFTIVLLLSALFVSCKKEGHTRGSEFTPEPEIYMPLRTGNYWIYEVFNADSNGTETVKPVLDSTYVAGTMMIRNQSYFVLHSTQFFPYEQKLRDSSGYIVNDIGQKLFSSTDFTTVFGDYYTFEPSGFEPDTMYRSVFKMAEKNVSCTVPAGNFITITAQTTTTIYPEYMQPGLNNPKRGISNYAKDVGIVYERFEFMSFNQYLGRRLKRYHVQH